MSASAPSSPRLAPDALGALQSRIQDAAARGQVLQVQGQGSKQFYGGVPQGELLDLTQMDGLSGVSAYEPSELVVTARAATPLAELEALLAAQGQHLAFEPPRFEGRGTVGGMVAAGLSGPSRATQGSLRDHVLGLTMINGRGELLSFGGTVMKNVAGYDLPRLMCGGLGVLGVIAEVSLKVLPLPVARCTLRFDMPEAEALQQMNRWSGLPLPLRASAAWDGALVLELAGAERAVAAARRELGGELIPEGMAAGFWRGLRDHSDEFFIGACRAVQGGAKLWRLSLPQTAPSLRIPGEQMIEWGGAQRWVTTPLPAAQLRELATQAGGHATLFRALDKSEGVFSPLSAPLARIHRDLKTAFDPAGVFNRGRLYPEF